MTGLIKKPGWVAIIIPGFLAGIIIWAFIWAGDNYLILSGTRADRFFIAAFFISPVILAGAGALAEIIRSRGGSDPWTPLIPYAAGFLGAFTAISIMLLVTGVDQYLPYNPPGSKAGLSWAVGHLIFCLPIVLPVSAVFGICSLIGGGLVHVVREDKKAP